MSRGYLITIAPTFKLERLAMAVLKAVPRFLRDFCSVQLVVLQRPLLPPLLVLWVFLFAFQVTHKYCLVKDKGEVPMKALRLGDKGRVANNEYESIYSFGHKNNETVTDFLQIFMEGSSHADCIRPLELSKDHMVFISSNQQGHGRAVPASIPRHLLD